MLARAGVLGLINRFAGRLRFPHLFLLTAVLFGLDLLIPDLLPLADELLLGLATLLLGAWKDRRAKPQDEPIGPHRPRPDDL